MGGVAVLEWPRSDECSRLFQFLTGVRHPRCLGREGGGERDQFCQEDFERATNRKESIYCETSTLMDEGV